MSFFPPVEPDPEPFPVPIPPAWGPPGPHQLGGFVPLRLELARPAGHVLLLGPFECFKTGIDFEIETRSRQPDLPHGMPMMMRSPGVLQVGVQFSDGRRTAIGHPWPADPATVPDHPVLSLRGGGGGGGVFRQHWWLWPLPPPGEVRFYVRWDDIGLEERFVTVDGAVLRDAADQAEQLWEPLTQAEEQEAVRRTVARMSQFSQSFTRLEATATKAVEEDQS